MNHYRLPFCLLIFLSCSSLALFGQVNSAANFTPHGPGGGGYMYSPVISPHDPNQVFLSCDMGGLYHSSNDGQTWDMLHYQNLVSMVKSKVQFSSDPNVLYTVRRSLTNLNDPLWRGELIKSTDAGQTWQAMPDPTSSGVHCIEVDPGSTQRLILNEYNQLFFSANGGNTWTAVFQPSDEQMWLGGVFWDGQNIYVGTNHGLLVSKNNGASFTLENHSGLPAGTGIYQLSGAKSAGVTRLFCIPAPSSEMFAWLEPLSFNGLRQGLFRMNYSANAAWANTRGNIPSDIDIAFVDLAKNNTQIVWAEGADPDSYTMTFKSTNGGQSWTNVYQTLNNQNISTGWSGAEGAYWLQQNGPALGMDVSDTDPNHVIRTNGVAEITNDGGASWRAVYVLQNDLNPIGQPTPIAQYYQSSGLDVTTSHHIHWKNEQEIYLCNTDIGLTYSPDAGESWTFSRNTFYDYGPVANNNWYRMVERPDNHELFAAVSQLNDMYLDYRLADSEIEGAGGLVVRSIDGGANWDTLHNFGHPVVWIELDKNNPDRMWVSVVHQTEGGVFRTVNGGQTWTRLSAPARTEGHPYNIVSLADGGLIVTYSARKLEDGNLTESSGVYFSADGGDSWQDRSAPGMRFYTKDLVVDPHDLDGSTWYASVWGRSSVWPGPNNQNNGGLYRTTDRGLNWTRIFAKTPVDQTESITIHPTKPGTAYLCIENDGLFFTENLDAATPTFERVTAFPWWRPKRVFFAPLNPDEVWVTSMGGGLWKGKTSPEGVVQYSPSSEDFANPERGFMQFTETHFNNDDPLDANELSNWRNLHAPGGGANYLVYSSLVYRGFYLENFKNGPISNAYLQSIQQDFDAARAAGVKLVLRFAYTQKSTAPYGDVPKNRVLEHIAQLKPYLMANADVIAVLQMGFIGAWGEGYYTDHFGFGSLNAQNWSDRTEVLNALLEALPADRSVQVRVPQMKQKAVYGPNAAPNAAPLNPAEAWGNTPKARIGFVNDCFLADETDSGTYINYDLNPSGCDTCVFKPYVANDSKYVPVGGETCSDWDPYSNCNGQPGGGAQTELARMHFSYLNSGWNNELNNDWTDGGCIEEIKQRLGYRLELQTGEFPTEAQAGQTISIKIGLKNKGFAAPFNARKIRLLLRNTVTAALWQVELTDEARAWLPGNTVHTIEHNFCLPSDMPTGIYELLLHLADPYAQLSDRPEYAIRLANQNTWEAATGFNRLLHQIVVNQTAGNPACSGETCFQSNTQITPTVEFSADIQSGCSPLTVKFSSPKGTCLNYAWSFPGGIPASSTETNPTVVYPNSGTFDVSLSLNNTAGTGVKLEPGFISVSALPSPLFSAFSSDLSVSFSNTSTGATSYSWNFGDGSALSTEANPSHTYNTPGIYSVVLSATNDCGTETFTQSVQVQCPSLSVAIVPVGSTQICVGDFVVLNATDGFQDYVWLYNGNPIVGENTANYSATTSGVYKVFCSDANGCGGFSNEITIEVSPLPIPEISTSTANGAVCIGEPSWLHGSGGVDYQWLTPSGLLVSGQEIQFPAVELTQAGVYVLTVTDGSGCSATTSFNFQVNPLPEAVIQPPGPIALTFGQNIQLDGGSGLSSWLWSTGETTAQISVEDCGLYTVVVIDDHGCSDTAPVVAVSVIPVITFANGVLSSTPSATYQWLFNGLPIPGATAQTYIPLESGNYAVQVNCTGNPDATSNVVQVIITGINSLNIRPILLYPNPVSADKNQLFLELQGLDPAPFTLVIADVAGLELKRISYLELEEKNSLNTHDIPAGTYFVQVWQKGKMQAAGMFLKL